MFAEFKFNIKFLSMLIFDMCVFAYIVCNMAINLPKMNLSNFDMFLVSLMSIATFYFIFVFVRPFIDKHIFKNGKGK